MVFVHCSHEFFVSFIHAGDGLSDPSSVQALKLYEEASMKSTGETTLTNIIYIYIKYMICE